VLVRDDTQYLPSPVAAADHADLDAESALHGAATEGRRVMGNCVCAGGVAQVTSTLVNDVYPAATTALHVSAYTRGADVRDLMG